MKKYIFCGIILGAGIWLGCRKNPVTGSSQLILVPDSQMQSMSYTQYRQFLGEHKISTNAEQTAMVKKVGVNIQKAVESYLAQKGDNKTLNGFQWEYNLVEDPTVNAWCMPGGKVVVYTGIMPVVQDETGLAVVLGHEIAHAIANHGAQRMSQGLLTQMGGVALQVALSQKPQQTQALFLQAYNVGGTLGTLSYSRKHESEADYMGLIFMAMAGYNPEKAVDFWQRMKASSAGSQKPPELLSTHPSDERRIADLQKNMPEAKKYYKGQ